jgi:mono/diheme cytochrome c family protein
MPIPGGVILHRLVLLLGTAAVCAAQQIAPLKVWDDKALADWATPVAGLNVRPGHFSEKDYYAATPAEWVRTYPVYFPGREPAGYWDMIRAQKPVPLITPGPRNQADWLAAGKRVFDELDVSAFRSYDPAIIQKARSAEEMTKVGARPLKDGRIFGLRWVPTSKGLAVSVQECAGCHVRVMPDGSLLDGAPVNDPGNGLIGELIISGLQTFFKGESVGMGNWRAFSVPWLPNDIHAGIKSMSDEEIGELLASNPTGTFPRFNGSPYYTTKIPDLIGVGERRYIDHTATHRLRGAGDIMRYAALVTCCDTADFRSHRALNDPQRVVFDRFSDDLLFALGQYIYSLKPPPNPHAADPRAATGKKVFEREGCGGCHTAPLYTNNKLTLATGFQKPKNHPNRADVMPVSVGTDPNLALKTRKGTGFYKVPSLKGVWYRGLYNHDGSVASLEDWFDPKRLRDDYVPTGFKGYKVKTRAVPGHEFGLKLSAEEKAALIAFLRTL